MNSRIMCVDCIYAEEVSGELHVFLTGSVLCALPIVAPSECASHRQKEPVWSEGECSGNHISRASVSVRRFLSHKRIVNYCPW